VLSPGHELSPTLHGDPRRRPTTFKALFASGGASAKRIEVVVSWRTGTPPASKTARASTVSKPTLLDHRGALVTVPLNPGKKLTVVWKSWR